MFSAWGVALNVTMASVQLRVLHYSVYLSAWLKLRGTNSRCRWVDNIELHLREIGWDGVDWIDLPQDRNQWRALLNMAMNLVVP
jgi:hypothetical protein